MKKYIAAELSKQRKQVAETVRDLENKLLKKQN